jgi:hypothetical protein
LTRSGFLLANFPSFNRTLFWSWFYSFPFNSLKPLSRPSRPPHSP